MEIEKDLHVHICVCKEKKKRIALKEENKELKDTLEITNDTQSKLLLNEKIKEMMRDFGNKIQKSTYKTIEEVKRLIDELS